MKKLLLCAVAALLGACAANQPTTSTEPTADKQYRTGSNIPRAERRGDVKVMTPEELEQMRNAARGNMGKGPGN